MGGAGAVAVTAAVQRDDVETLVGEDLAGVLPGKAVLPPTVQHQNRWVPVRRLGAVVPFVSDKDEILDAAKLHRLRFAACSAHGRPLGWPRALQLPSRQSAHIFRS